MIKRIVSWIDTQMYLFYTKRKISLANKLFKLTGKQHHVVPYDKYKLKVVNNEFIKFYNAVAKKKGIKRITYIELLKMSIYSTKQKQ